MPSRSAILRRFAVALTAAAALALVVGTLGPTDIVSAATTGSTTTSGGAVVTETITEPAITVTEPSTAQPPGTTTSIINHTTTVQVAPAPTTSSEQSSTGGMPDWGWVLIGVGVVLFGLLTFLLGRHRSNPAGGPPTTPGPGVRS